MWEFRKQNTVCREKKIRLHGFFQLSRRPISLHLQKKKEKPSFNLSPTIKTPMKKENWGKLRYKKMGKIWEKVMLACSKPLVCGYGDKD